MDLKDFEIMAPVGSRESLAAAIQAGFFLGWLSEEMGRKVWQ